MLQKFLIFDRNNIDTYLRGVRRLSTGTGTGTRTNGNTSCT